MVQSYRPEEVKVVLTPAFGNGAHDLSASAPLCMSTPLGGLSWVGISKFDQVNNRISL